MKIVFAHPPPPPGAAPRIDPHYVAREIARRLLEECWWADATEFHPGRGIGIPHDALVVIPGDFESCRRAARLAESFRAEGRGQTFLLAAREVPALPDLLPREFDGAFSPDLPEALIELAARLNAHPGRREAILHDSPGIVSRVGLGPARLAPPLPHWQQPIDRRPLPDFNGPTPALARRLRGADGLPAIRMAFGTTDCCPIDWTRAPHRPKTPRTIAAELANSLAPEAPGAEVRIVDPWFIGPDGGWRETLTALEPIMAERSARWRVSLGPVTLDEPFARELVGLRVAAIDLDVAQGFAGIISGRTGFSIGVRPLLGAPRQSAVELESLMDDLRRHASELDRCEPVIVLPVPGSPAAEALDSAGEGTPDPAAAEIRGEEHQWQRIPMLSPDVSREALAAAWRDARSIAQRINAEGSVRLARRRLQAAEAARERAESELAQLKGSRVIRAANKLRQTRT